MNGATETFISILVLARIYQDPSDGLIYIESPHLDIISAGRDEKEARAVFNEAIDLTFRDWVQDGVLRERLREYGFVTHSQRIADCEFLLLTPPEVQVESQPQPSQALPARYNIETMPFNLSVEAVCMA